MLRVNVCKIDRVLGMEDIIASNTEEIEYTFPELVQYMKQLNHVSSWPVTGNIYEWLSVYESSFHEPIETETSLHYNKDNPKRKEKYWRKAMIAAGFI